MPESLWYRPSGIIYLLQSIWCHLSCTFYPVPSIWFRLSAVVYLVPSILYRISRTVSLITPIWYRLSGTSYPVPSIWYRLLGALYLIPSIWYRLLFLFVDPDMAQHYHESANNNASYSHVLSLFFPSFWHFVLRVLMILITSALLHAIDDFISLELSLEH